MVYGVPPELLRWDLHGGGQLHLVGFEERLPTLGVVEAQPRGVLPFEGIDQRPHRAVMLLRLLHHRVQIHWLSAEQAVAVVLFRAGAHGHILHISLRPRQLLHAVPDSDVADISPGLARLDEAALLDQLGHGSQPLLAAERVLKADLAIGLLCVLNALAAEAFEAVRVVFT